MEGGIGAIDASDVFLLGGTRNLSRACGWLAVNHIFRCEGGVPTLRKSDLQKNKVSELILYDGPECNGSTARAAILRVE